MERVDKSHVKVVDHWMVVVQLVSMINCHSKNVPFTFYGMFLFLSVVHILIKLQ